MLGFACFELMDLGEKTLVFALERELLIAINHGARVASGCQMDLSRCVQSAVKLLHSLSQRKIAVM